MTEQELRSRKEIELSMGLRSPGGKVLLELLLDIREIGEKTRKIEAEALAIVKQHHSDLADLTARVDAIEEVKH